MDLPELKKKSYTVKLDYDDWVMIENWAEAVQERPSALIRELVRRWCTSNK